MSLVFLLRSLRHIFKGMNWKCCVILFFAKENYSFFYKPLEKRKLNARE